MLFPACGFAVIAVMDCADAGPLSATNSGIRAPPSDVAAFCDVS
jgi:hypothetical protein